MRTSPGLRAPRIALAIVVALVAGSSASPAEPRRLSLDDRIAAQKAIEEVYWRHRIWPKENPGPKPPLSDVLSDDTIRARVEDSLRKSSALERLWNRPITAEQLQAELNRMVRDTRDGAMLRELFRALGDDPYVIAETLARQSLADRLLRNWYSSDPRFHGELKRRAEMALRTCGTVACMKSLGGDYREATWRLRTERPAAEPDSALTLDADAWTDHLAKLAALTGGTADSLSIGKPGGLEESREGFSTTAAISHRAGEVTTATVTWPKESFSAWWGRESARTDSDVLGVPRPFALPSVPAAVCADNTWSETGLTTLPGQSNATAVWTGSEMILWGGSIEVDSGLTLTNTGRRYNPSTDAWSETSTGAGVPGTRYRHTAVWTGTRMIIWGGDRDGPRLNDGGAYDPMTDSWTPTSTGVNAPSARTNHTAVWTGTHMVIWGGVIASGNANTGGRYDPSTDSWLATSTGTNVPTGRNNHTAVWTGTRMIVWGGYDGSHLSTGGLYDPSTDSWTTTSTGANLPIARRSHTAIWTGTFMIVWGGELDLQPNRTNTGGRYHPATNTWAATSLGANVPSARTSHTAVWTGSRMIIWGGDGSPELNTGGRYDPASDVWTATSTGGAAPSARQHHVAVWTGAEMLVWGGSLSAGRFPNSGGRYQPATDTWVATNRGRNAPSPRQAHTAVWTGAEMIVWGGANLDPSSFNTGGRYDPAIDSWTDTSIGANVPTERHQHTAVWTGTGMVVWGGWKGSTNTLSNTGGRYNPASDSWVPTSVGANLPAAREAHSAVWTGTEMVVWGGYNGSYLSTGGRYNPAADTWSATSTTNAPAARISHASAWSGSQMLIWGGFASAYLNTGGRYDPASNVWTTMSPALIPGVADATAVWTGTQMIVWGGYNGAYVNTGARYSPSSDSWAATSLVSAPTARRFHAAIWSGAEMVAWGGFNGNLIGTGGRYNPSVDTWTLMAAEGARRAHSAVWTGSEMVVWGGGSGSVVFDTGSRYCACLTSATWFRDADGDGHGDAAQSMSTCNGAIPAGHSGDDTDCDDAHAQVYPGAAEVNDGLDNQCPGDSGYGSVDELPGLFGFVTAGNKNSISWSPQPGATGYDVARSPYRDLHAGCKLTSTAAPSLTDSEIPAAGGAFYYLVRAADPRRGSWGQRSPGAERVVCGSCDPGAGDCDDGNACTAGDTCSGSVCVSGSPRNCDDGSPLTNDSCGPASGCAHACNTPPGANHLVISQVQVEGDGVSAMEDEFVELYNPTASPISLAGKSLQWKTNAGSAMYFLHAFGAGVTVPAHGWFLLARAGYDGPVPADQLNASFPLANVVGNLFLVSDTVLLFGACPSLATVIDKLSYGTGACPESVAAPQPPPNDSILRRPGAVCGNGQDTNNNAADFALQSPATPRNTASPPQPE